MQVVLRQGACPMLVSEGLRGEGRVAACRPVRTGGRVRFVVGGLHMAYFGTRHRAHPRGAAQSVETLPELGAELVVLGQAGAQGRLQLHETHENHTVRTNITVACPRSHFRVAILWVRRRHGRAGTSVVYALVSGCSCAGQAQAGCECYCRAQPTSLISPVSRAIASHCARASSRRRIARPTARPARRETTGNSLGPSTSTPAPSTRPSCTKDTSNIARSRATAARNPGDACRANARRASRWPPRSLLVKLTSLQPPALSTPFPSAEQAPPGGIRTPRLCAASRARAATAHAAGADLRAPRVAPPPFVWPGHPQVLALEQASRPHRHVEECACRRHVPKDVDSLNRVASARKGENGPDKDCAGKGVDCCCCCG
eukprot:scaffold2045_cov404-Prasinococcus_capsulatus_cf.AAC.36